MQNSINNKSAISSETYSVISAILEHKNKFKRTFAAPCAPFYRMQYDSRTKILDFLTKSAKYTKYLTILQRKLIRFAERIRIRGEE